MRATFLILKTIEKITEELQKIKNTNTLLKRE